MRKKVKNLKMFFFFLVTLHALLFTPCRAEDLKITASVSSRKISVSEQLKLTISVEGQTGRAPGLTLPALPDFDVYSSGTSQNVSIINGRVSSVFENNYILVPKREGQLLIPSFEINYKDKKYTTSPISIEVTAAPQAAPGQPQKLKAESFWIEQAFDKNTCYTGEPVYYTFSFFADRGLSRNPSLTLPAFGGFLKEDLPPPRHYNTAVNGKNYFVTEVKLVIFPVKSGAYGFSPANLEIADAFFPSAFNDDFFADFFGRRSRRKILKTEPLSLQVKNLPDAGKPKNYKGDIGSFGITAQTDKKNAKVGEAVNLIVEIKGEGNISSITCPDFPEFVNFKHYEVISSQNLEKEDYKITGSKKFQTVLVPRVSGTLKIPGIEYSFFDPAKKKYEKIKTKEINIEVAPSASAKQYPIKLKEVSRDIRHIAGVSRLKKDKGVITDFFWLCQAVPLGVFFLTFFIKNRVYEKIIPGEIVARRTALRRAKTAAGKTSGDYRNFCQDMERILVNFIKDRLNTVKIESAGKTLAERKVSAGMIAKVNSFVTTCQLKRFSPQESPSDREALKRELLKILKDLEKWI
ncbi:MAG: BatD family protein [bacterium]